MDQRTYHRDSPKRETKPRRGLQSLASGGRDHRHPIQFSGDALSHREMPALFEVKPTACSGQGGCYYWAVRDIGGFRGEPNPTKRATPTGALSAASSACPFHHDKRLRPDVRGISREKETALLRRMYHMRSGDDAIYIYSSSWQTHNTMVPLNRSMFIDYGDL